MKTSILVILFLICPQVLSQVNDVDKINHRDILQEREVNKIVLDNGFLLVEELVEWYNPPSKEIIDYTYDGNGNMIEKIFQNLDGSEWKYVGRDTCTYDESNNMIEKIKYWRWGINWNYGSRIAYKYDENNNLIEEVYQNRDNAKWVSGGRVLSTYDERNNMTERLAQDWSRSDNKWYSYNKNIFIYDEDNNLIEELGQNTPEWDGTWEDWFKVTYTYNNHGNMIEEIRHERGRGFGGYSSNWASYKFSYTYDEENNLVESLEQLFADSSWINSWRLLSTFDENNNIIEDLVQDFEDSSWINHYRGLITFDENNNMIELLEQEWFSSSWVNIEKKSYTYIPITGIELDNAKISTYQLSNNYPNPFNPTTKINYSTPKQSHVSLKVFDVLGREVSLLVNKEQPQGNYEVEFDASILTSGIYFYRIQAGDFIETKKMILMK